MILANVNERALIFKMDPNAYLEKKVYILLPLRNSTCKFEKEATRIAIIIVLLK